MKKRIRLGISSMANCVRTSSQPQLSSPSLNLPKSTITNLSPHDLDDMFETNLQLLQDLENTEHLSNKCSNTKHFKSSLNVYMAPNQIGKPKSAINVFRTFTDIPLTNVLKSQLNETKSKKLNHSNIYSSYEALYDDLLYTTEKKEREWECMSQSMIENSTIGSNLSIDSDKTLKSSESFNSIHFEEINESFSNQNLSMKQLVLNKVDLNPKLRLHSNKILTRPISYHLGDFSSYNCSNKPPSHPFNYSNKNKEIKNEIAHSTNIPINESLKSPSPSNSFLNNFSAGNKNPDNVTKEQLKCLTPIYSLSSSNIINNNHNNIINNQILYTPQSSKNQSSKIIYITPPLPPPRNRIITNAPQITKNITTSPSSIESHCENKQLSHINRNNSVNERKVKVNGRRYDRRIQNYDNEFSFLDRQMNNFLCLKSVQICKMSKK